MLFETSVFDDESLDLLNIQSIRIINASVPLLDSKDLAASLLEVLGSIVPNCSEPLNTKSLSSNPSLQIVFLSE